MLRPFGKRPEIPHKYELIVFWSSEDATFVVDVGKTDLNGDDSCRAPASPVHAPDSV